MKRDLEDLFTELTPPPGGAERFARRLERTAAAPGISLRRVAVFAAAASVVGALVTALIVVRQPNEVSPAVASAPDVEIYDAPELDRLLGRSARPVELVVTVNAEAATVTEITTANDKVRIYRVN
jgi:hypothetical protein